MPAPRLHQEFVADITYVTTGGATWYFALSDSTTLAEDTSAAVALSSELGGNDGYTTPVVSITGYAWDVASQKVKVVIPDFVYENTGTTTIQASAILTVCCPSGHTRKVPKLITQSNFDGAANTVTSTNHGYVDGDGVVFRASAGTLDSAINSSTLYKVLNASANSFQLSINEVDPVDLNGDAAGLTGYIIDATLDARGYTYKQFVSPVSINPGQNITVKYSHAVDTLL